MDSSDSAGFPVSWYLCFAWARQRIPQRYSESVVRGAGRRISGALGKNPFRKIVYRCVAVPPFPTLVRQGERGAAKEAAAAQVLKHCSGTEPKTHLKEMGRVGRYERLWRGTLVLGMRGRGGVVLGSRRMCCSPWLCLCRLSISFLHCCIRPFAHYVATVWWLLVFVGSECLLFTTMRPGAAPPVDAFGLWLWLSAGSLLFRCGGFASGAGQPRCFNWGLRCFLFGERVGRHRSPAMSENKGTNTRMILQ